MQQNSISRLLSLNDSLLQYIDHIEEVKSSGGVSTFRGSEFDCYAPRGLRTKLITIPEVKILVLEEED